MESSVSIVDPADEVVVSREVPGWSVFSTGYMLAMNATVTMRTSEDIWPPQLIMHFTRRTISPSTHAVEIANFDINQPYQNIIRQAAWDDETTSMLGHVAGRQLAGHHVATSGLNSLVRGLRAYTRMVLRHFPIMELSTMEFFSVIEIHSAAPPSISASGLHYSVPFETHQIIFRGDNDDIEPIRGPTPAPAAAMEGLRTKLAEEPDVCSICLDDFDVATEVLEMSCRHIFHDKCLREWLARSNTCPLCRFALLPEAQ